MYKTLSAYLKERYGKRIRKICIDGGFSCPNRDGTCGIGGCIFCGERGAGEHINARTSIEAQVREGLSRTRAEGYVAYFQNFTNTYAEPDVLRERYSSALIDDRILILAIGTRPDCISREVCEIIASFRDRVDVWVELGLQNASDEVAAIINRGYTTDVYESAANLLREYEIPFVTHIMIGLPGETPENIDKTLDAVIKSGTWGIKIHSTYVMEGTRLAEMYREKLYTPPTFDYYTDTAARLLSRLPEGIVVHRITGDCPDGMLVAPEWSREKSKVIDTIRAKAAAISESQA